jgi:hypothetical protein
MTGYWKDVIEKGHKTGPYRTSIDAIKDYEKIINDPLNHKVKLERSNTFIKPENFNFDKDKIVNITKKSIPIKLTILDNTLLEELIILKGGMKDLKKCVQILKLGIENKKIIIDDHNNKSNNMKSFSFDDPYYKRVYIRKCTRDKKAKNYRFDRFLDSHNKRKPNSQEIKKDSFSLDINYVDYVKDGINIPKGLAFISYELRPLSVTKESEENINISNNI